MSYLIDEEIKYAGNKDGKIIIRLNPNKQLTKFDQSGPVKWSGYVDNDFVSLTWEKGEFYKQSNYNLNDYPEEALYALDFVIKLIYENSERLMR